MHAYVHSWSSNNGDRNQQNDKLLGVFCLYVTRFAKTQHNDAFLEFQIFASVSFMYLKLCSVAILVLYC